VIDHQSYKNDHVATSRPQEELLAVHVTWLWPDALVLAIGEVDDHTVGRLEARIREAMDEGATRVVVDTSGVSFLAVAGLRALEAAGAELGRRGGELIVVDPPRSLRLILGALRTQVPFRVTTTPLQAR
jgi:anti-anti-sigma factor